MQDTLMIYYPWLLSLHIISVIAWMAGMLYLPRLFVYHAAAAPKSELSETLKVMEHRLLTYIMRPAMIATILFGGLMLYANAQGIMAQHWIHAKLTLVILMVGLHHVFGAWKKKFARDANTRSPKFYRVWNEVPTVLMILIVILVVVKPF